MKCLVVLSGLFSSIFALDLLASSSNSSGDHSALVSDKDGKFKPIGLNKFNGNIKSSFDPEQYMFFNLFTRKNPTVPQRINVDDLASVRNSSFNPNHPTRAIVHGWGGSAEAPLNTRLAAEYLSQGEFNIIAVDWSKGARNFNYLAAKNQVGPVGVRLAQLMDFLHLHGFVRFKDLHFIGMSLGAHAVGFAGRALTRGKVEVIHSLDPAAPLYSLDDPANRITSSDGVYVEVLLTNGGGSGLMGAIGHANFFANFGKTQPGCLIDACNHMRATDLFIESINSVFTGHECASFKEINAGSCTRTGRTARMGGPFGNVGLTGNYIFETNAASPFTRG